MQPMVFSPSADVFVLRPLRKNCRFSTVKWSALVAYWNVDLVDMYSLVAVKCCLFCVHFMNVGASVGP